MSTRLEIVQGAHEDYPLQCWNRGTQTAATFLATDEITAYVYPGQTEAVTFAPSVAWYTAGSTQTGYGQGQIQVTITSAQAATLEANGIYTLECWKSPSGSSESSCVWRGELLCLPGAGTSAQTVLPYCQLSDMLMYAPWIQQVQQRDIDGEGFYSQRLQAREWLDWLIIRAWRGTSAAYFGDAGRSAQFWLGSWVRRTPLPSYWLIGVLSGGIFINGNITITNPGTNYYSIPTVTVPAPPVGANAQVATLSANLNGTGGIGSIFVNTPGLGYTPGSTVNITIAAPVGGGTTATATCFMSTGTLIVRPNIVRICALKAISIIGEAQIGMNNQMAAYGAYFRDKASAEVLNVVAELDLNGDGIADLPIPINPTNTMFT